MYEGCSNETHLRNVLGEGGETIFFSFKKKKDLDHRAACVSLISASEPVDQLRNLTWILCH
jgi:hypothetical protein